MEDHNACVQVEVSALHSQQPGLPQGRSASDDHGNLIHDLLTILLRQHLEPDRRRRRAAAGPRIWMCYAPPSEALPRPSNFPRGF